MWPPLIFVILLVASSTISRANAACNVCNSNGIACINATAYNFCFDGKTPDPQVFDCGPGFICIASGLKCIEAELNKEVEPACLEPEKENRCGICNSVTHFACTNKTTFASCLKGQLTTNIGKCPGKLICDASKQTICVDECSANKNQICNLDSPLVQEGDSEKPTPKLPITPASIETTTATTPAGIFMDAHQVCASQNRPGRFLYPGDKACHTYAYCFYNDNILTGIQNSCPWNSYFDSGDQICVTDRIPIGCVY